MCSDGGGAVRDYVPTMRFDFVNLPRSTASCALSVLAAASSLALAPRSDAADIYATSFDAYGTGTLSGQLAWIGTGGSWAVSGATNVPQIPANVIGAGVDPGISPVGGAGRMVRLCSERFNAGRTKAWLDLANSGRWASASKGGNGVLETRIKIYIPSGQALTSAFGVMVSRDAVQTAGGFVVSAQTGAVSFLNNGYALANRTPVGVTVPLNSWNEFVYRWTVATGEGELLVNGVRAGGHVTTLSGAVYASNLLATTDATPGTLNAFGYFDDFAVAAVPPAPPSCTADLNGDGTRDAQDLAIMLGTWGATGGSNAGDVTGDGTTDAQDLAVLLGSWGPC